MNHGNNCIDVITQITAAPTVWQWSPEADANVKVAADALASRSGPNAGFGATRRLFGLLNWRVPSESGSIS